MMLRTILVAASILFPSYVSKEQYVSLTPNSTGSDPYQALQPINPRDPNGLRFIRNVPLDLVLTIFTCGLWNLRVQYIQMQAVNAILGKEKYRFLPWLCFTFLTCGLYHIYHEYLKSIDIAHSIKKTNEEPILEIILIVFGLSIVADAIQQAMINKYFGVASL
jgi:hypothetical protein